MSKFLYFLATFAESGLSVFGIRGAYEQPRYAVVQTLSPAVEIRAYAPRMAVETDIVGGDQGQAFGRLFRYITGKNMAGGMVAMTVPVAIAEPSRLAMTLPVETGGNTGDMPVMRFFLPAAVVAAGAPAPAEKGVRLENLPAVTLGVIRYSGSATDETRASQAAALRVVLGQAGRVIDGKPLYFSYDPPFTIPFLRRNEVALGVK